MKTQPLLYELLKKLKKEELRQLKKFLRADFVTHREDISALFNHLAKYLYLGKALPEKRFIFAQLYTGEYYNDQKLRNTMSDLHALIEQYLIWKTVQKNEVGAQLALTSVYRQRNLPKHFQRSIRKVKHKQQRQSFRNPDYYQQFLRYQIEKAEFQTTNQRTGNLNLQEIGDTMDVLYLSQKLRHACTQLSHRAVFQTDYQFGLLKEWINVLEDSPYLAVPAVALYYYCYRFLTEAYSQVYFRKFRQELSTHQTQFPREERKDLYRAAINFCIRKLNEGSLEFTREGWELFQEGLQEDVFTENQQLSRFTFDNIVGFGLRLKEHAAVEKFIEDNRSKLSLDYRENTVSFNAARLEYSRKNYEKALYYLHTANSKDLVNQLISKTLLLKIYYESNELNLLESHLDNFRLFIRRRELSDYHQSNFQNIISYTRKLIALQPYNPSDREKLKKAIEQEAILTEKEWLLGNL